PVPVEGVRERFLPECSFRGRENRKLQFAVLAAAALHGGAEADLLDEVTWWQTDDFWQYALFAAVAYIRITADRAGVPVRQVCQELAQRPGSRPSEAERLRERLDQAGLLAEPGGQHIRPPRAETADARGRAGTGTALSQLVDEDR